MATVKRKKVVEIEREGRKVRRKPLVNEDSRPEREGTAGDIFRAVGGQAIGLLVGGLIGGRDGAIQGGQQGAATGAAVNAVLNAAQARDDERHDKEFAQSLALDSARSKEEQNAILNSLSAQRIGQKAQELGEKKIRTNIIDPATNQPLVEDKFGNITTLDGKAFSGTVRNLDDEKQTTSKDRLAVSRENLEERRNSTDLSAKRLAFAQFNKDEVSDKQAERFIDIASSIKASNRIAELVGKVNIGPVEGRAQALASAFGISTSEFEKLKVATGIQLVNFIKKTSGAAVSEPEARRLQSLIASVNDTPEQFQARLSEFKRSLTDEYDTVANSIFKLQGKRVASLDSLLSGTGNSAARDSQRGSEPTLEGTRGINTKAPATRSALDKLGLGGN